MVLLKKVNNADVGTADLAGGNDWDQMSDALNYIPPSSADFNVYIDTNDSNKVKAVGKLGSGVEFTHATDLGNVLTSIHGSLSSTSGGTIRVKSGSYGWATKLSVTKAHVGLFADRGVIVTQTNAADTISVEKDHFHIQNFYYDCTSVGNGNGSWINAGATTNSDYLKVYNCHVKSPGTNGILLDANCGGASIAFNQIQSFLAPTGDGIICDTNADHEIIANGIGGFANATNGYGIRLSSAINCIIALNRVFVNRIGIRLYYFKGCIVTENLIQANEQHGLQLKNDTATQRGNSIISNNRIHDNSTSAAGNYDGINIAISSTGGLDNVTITGNVVTDQSVASKKQAYGVNINSALLTNSVISNNALAGNLTGAIKRGALSPTVKIVSNSADPILDLNSALDTVSPAVMGTLSPGNGSELRGILIGATLTGAVSSQVTTAGLTRRTTAAGAAGDNAGYIQTITTSRLAWNSEFYIRFALSHTQVDERAFFGFCSASTTPTGNDALNALSGIMLYVIDGVTTFRIGKNNGSGATTFVDTGVTVDTAVHYFRIAGDDANSRFGWSFDNLDLTWETTDIPVSATNLVPLLHVEAVTATAVYLDIYKWVIKNPHI